MGLSLLSISTVVKADASDISLTLCEWSDKEFMIDAGEEKEYCFSLNNKSSEDYIVSYGFTESIINNIGRQLCNGGISADNSFAVIFKNPAPKDITLLSWETKIIKEKLMIPVGMTGTIYGCVSYNVKGSAHQTKGSIFEVLISRTLPVKIFVGKMADIKSDVTLLTNKGSLFTTNNKIKAILNEEELQLSFLVQNNGNIEQSVIITWKIYNMLWFEKEFSALAKKIGVGESSEIIANVGILPFYKWFFSVKVNVEHTPSFAFNTSALDEETLKAWQQSDTGKIYIFSWISIVVVIVLILLILKLLPFKIFGKKTKAI